MRIVNLSEEFNPHFEEELLRSTDRHWLGDFLQQRGHSVKNRMKTVLVALQERSAKEMLSKVVSESLLVQYFPSGNYGFVKFLTVNDPHKPGHKEHNANDTRVQLVKEAISVVNKVSFHLTEAVP